MLRTIGRVACIAAVGTLIAVALFFLVERAAGAGASDFSPGFRGGQPGRWQDAADPPATSGGDRAEQASRRARPRHGQRENHGEFSPARGIGGLSVTIVQVGLVAGVVAGLQKRARRKRHGASGSP